MLYVPVHNQTFFVATTMSGFAGSTLSLARQLVTPRRASSWMLFAGVCGSTAPVATVLCEAPKENLLPKDKNGNVEWSRIPSHLTDSAFWDTLAKSTGSSVRTFQAPTCLPAYLKPVELPLVDSHQTPIYISVRLLFNSRHTNNGSQRFKMPLIPVFRHNFRMVLFPATVPVWR